MTLQSQPNVLFRIVDERKFSPGDLLVNQRQLDF